MKTQTVNFIITVVIIALLALPVSAQELWPGLEKGEYEVGYSIEHLYDANRNFRITEKSPMIQRPMQISIWYPAIRGQLDSYRYTREYLFASITRFDFKKASLERKDQELKDVLRFVENNKGNKDKASKYYSTLTWAIDDADAAPGKFPLVIYAPGRNSAATNNYILCEYLASHGYVVAAVGSQGVNRPDVSGDISGFEALLKDMEFLREHTSLKSFVDKKKVAIIGHSFGGMSATLYSCKNKVDAVINFDGSNFAIGWQNLFKSFEYAKPENMSAAYMYLMSDPPTDSGFNHETFFMNGLKEKAVLAKIKGFGHGDYMSYYAALEYFAGVIPPMFPKDDMNFIATGFKHVCYSSKAFLDIHVKKGKEISGNLMDGYFLQRAQADLAFNNGDFILVESK